MTILNIYSLDDTEQKHVIVSLPEGKHVIGRDLLKVRDLKVSRKHALIEVLEDQVLLTALHYNPCFLKAVNGTLRVITQNQKNVLTDGDHFAFLPEDYWFTVQIKKEMEEPQCNGKRLLDTHLKDSNSVSTTKKARLSHTDEGTSGSCAENNITESRFTEQLPNNCGSNNASHNEEANNSSEQKCKDSSDVGAMVETIKEEPHVNEEEPPSTADNITNPPSANGSSPQGTARRERCWYGERCFRKNPHHRMTFSHPGDQDYDASNQDDPPECPYGISCYRINPEHRRQYKHLSKPAPKPSNANVNLNVFRGCPYCEHCKRNTGGGGGKPDYESDVDDY